MDRILIAVPTHDYIHAAFVHSLIRMQGYLHRQGVKHEIALEAGTLVYIARNRLANKGINEHFSHVLWLDSDMVFGEDILETLMWCDKDIVCGAFQSRRKPFSSCVFTDIRPGRTERVQAYGTEPFRVAGCGFACVLTKVETLRAVQEHYMTCFTPTPEHGEDLAFCDRAARIGKQIWCEPTARVGHVAHIPIWPEDQLPGG